LGQPEIAMAGPEHRMQSDHGSGIIELITTKVTNPTWKLWSYYWIHRSLLKKENLLCPEVTDLASRAGEISLMIWFRHWFFRSGSGKGFNFP
jgi:hypothetical protein